MHRICTSCVSLPNFSTEFDLEFEHVAIPRASAAETAASAAEMHVLLTGVTSINRNNERCPDLAPPPTLCTAIKSVFLGGCTARAAAFFRCSGANVPLIVPVYGEIDRADRIGRSLAAC